MRAVVLREPGGPEQMKLTEVDVPRPGRGEILVKVRACGVCYHDVVVRNGTMRRGFIPGGMILGHEVAGEIAEVGDEVEGFKVGDRVTNKQIRSCGQCKWCRGFRETQCEKRHFNDGGYAEYMVFAEESLVHIPPGIAFEHAAICSCAIGTVFHAIRDEGDAKPGDTVLVTGAGGGLGVHSVQVAKLCGARVIAVTSSEDKIPQLKELGADEVVHSRDLNFHEQVMKLTEGQGVDVVVDNVGSLVFNSSFRSLGKFGRFVFIGQLTGSTVTFNPAFIFFKACKFLGSSSTTREELRQVLGLVHQGKLKPILTGTYPLEDAVRVHQLMEDRKIFGRVALIP